MSTTTGNYTVKSAADADAADAALAAQVKALADRVAALEGGTKPPVTPPAESAEATTVPPAAQLVDAMHNVFSIMAGQVGINGTADAKTANVTGLYYKAHQCVHQNTAGNWYAAAMSGGPPSGTATYTQVASPVPVPVPQPGSHFTVVLAGFRDPNGQPWNMKGLNAGVQDAIDGWAQVFNQYPHMNCLRLNTGSNDATSAIDQVVQRYNSKGCVVMIEDHSGNANNVAWYTQMATTYKNNAMVFLEMPNEPNASNLVAIQIGLVNAIRAAGFANPIALQPVGGYDFSNIGPVLTSVGKTQLFVTPHIYYSGSDPNGPAAYVQADINNATNLGLFSSIDEYGDAMDGWNRDPYGAQVISAVIAANQQGKTGAVFWAMDNGNHPNGADSAFLTRDGSQLTPVGAGPIKAWLA